MPDIKHQKGTAAELVVAQYLVQQGYFVFSPVVHQNGPVDLVAINELGDVLLIDAKSEAKRANPGRKKQTRINRVLSNTQRRLSVRLAYVSADNVISFKPPLSNEDSNEENLYFLRIKEYKISDQISPLEFVRNDIKQIILNKRKVAIANQLEEEVFEKAKSSNKYEIYNQ